MSQLIYTVFETLVTGKCISCGCTFAMPQTLQQQRLRDQQIFYCPNGHQQHYCGEREEERLKRELLATQQSRDAARVQRDKALQEAEHFRKSRNGMKGQLALTKNSISKGVCPCCTRTFADLASHMENKHPGYGLDVPSKP